MFALWEDVADFLDGTRAPEPLFFRAHSNDCIEYHHTNLVPQDYELDDFQVRTPTDIIGQHIHLVKFDVTSLRRRGQRLELRGRHARAGRGARAHRRHPRATTAARSRPINPPNCPGRRSRTPSSAPGRTTAWLGAQDHRAALVRRPGARDGNGTTAPWARSSRTTTSAPPPTSRPASTRRSSSRTRGSHWRDPETGTVFGTRPTAAPPAGGPTSVPRPDARLPRVQPAGRRLHAGVRGGGLGGAPHRAASAHQPAGQGRGGAARPPASALRAQRRAAGAVPQRHRPAAVPRDHLGGRPRHDVGQLPQRAPGPARPQTGNAQASGTGRRPVAVVLVAARPGGHRINNYGPYGAAPGRAAARPVHAAACASTRTTGCG